MFAVGALLRPLHPLSTLAVDTVRAVRNEFDGRQVWARSGRAHIEARGAHRADVPPDYPDALREAVEALEGVNWAAVNGALGDVVVDFDSERVGIAALRAAIDGIETAYGLSSAARDRPVHPGGFEPVFDEVVSLTADLVGAAVGTIGRFVPALSVPPETIAITHSIELLPALRARLDARFGGLRVETSLALAGSVIAAAARTPLVSLADGALRAIRLPAAIARREAWEAIAPELTRSRRDATATAQPPPSERPVPLPPGPIERYVTRARVATVATATVLAPTAGPRKAARAIALGAPRAAHIGAQAYRAQLGLLLAHRRVLVRDPASLRRLDRIDRVVIDARILVDHETGALDPLAVAVVAAAHDLGAVLIATDAAGFDERLEVDEQVEGGKRLPTSIHDLQSEGHAVLVVAVDNGPALAAADCAVGLVSPDRSPPWAADLLCTNGLTDVWLILRACLVSRHSSMRSAQLAMLGSMAGGVLGLFGPDRGAYGRGALPVGLSALIAVGAAAVSARSLARLEPTVGDNTAWHSMPIEEALRTLRTDAEGLSDAQAEARRTHDTERPPEQTLWQATVGELNTPLTVPLTAGAGVSAANGSILDAGLVTVVMLGNALLGAVQRLTANRAVRQLAEFGALRARVRRRGGEADTPSDRLVPGDIVLLRAGDAVPADCRLLEAAHLEVDESSLTGESMPVPKDPAPVDADVVAERSSMLYAGTTVVAGSATAVAVAVAGATEVGRGSLLGGSDTGSAGVERQLRELTELSVRIAVGAAAAVLGLGVLRGRPGAAVSSAVALAVAAVPEGLPFVATVAQLAAARRLSERKVLVRTPRTLEALGRVSTVCFDKTGTLTEGRIELRRVSDGVNDQQLDALDAAGRTILAAALRATPPDTPDRPLTHPTDRAVAAGGSVCDLGREDGEPGWRMLEELPFEPERGFHAVLGCTPDRHLISVKGAPEIVIPRCDRVRRDGEPIPLADEGVAELEQAVRDLADQGYRVLAVAERAASDRTELGSDRVDRLDFVGLLCLADPVRPTAAAAVRDLREAGVDAVMLTGDHPRTAEAIATELGLRTSGRVVTGTEVETCTEEQLAALVAETAVFARVSPVHKAMIVRALRHSGRTVAVTGDGANDAPAIQLADVGIALGPKSTPAAKHAADIIVTDERIETIVDAVIESRALWRSVRDSVGLLVGGNFGEIAFTLISSALGSEPALNARQLLAVNLLTDLLPALVVAARPPRDVTPQTLLHEGPDTAVGAALRHDVVNKAIATTLSATSGWLTARVLCRPRQVSTVGFAALVGSQLVQTVTTAHGDPLILAAAIGSTAALVTIVQLPPINYFFGCRPLGPVGWTVAALASGAAVLVTAAEKSGSHEPGGGPPRRDQRRPAPGPSAVVPSEAPAGP
ncbi:cation-translocating P-type ATPase [Nocardia arizonensis]|uniref:cation-translocating P-type ATPase n=1 Tax=Nocardia arizonensis TaxID=1141647 RepID=UPI0006CF2C94|nr:cation-translocating P-type ATPase [Nocardia arizonensis]